MILPVVAFVVALLSLVMAVGNCIHLDRMGA